MLRRDLRDATLGMIWDPVVADFCALAGEGARLRLRLDGKVGPLSGAPLDIEAQVLKVGHDLKQAFFGCGEPDLSMGRSAAIRIGGWHALSGHSTRHASSRDCWQFERLDDVVVRSATGTGIWGRRRGPG